MKKTDLPVPARRRILQRAALLGAAFAMPARAALARKTSKATPMEMLTANEIRDLLKLEPNAICGFVRVTFESNQILAEGVLPEPFTTKRPLGSAIYFLVTPIAPVRLHRIRNDQLYHYYLGDPLEVFLLHGDGTHERVVVGPDIRNGERVQLMIPGNTFHTARLIGNRHWFLGASTEWPGVIPEDVEIGDVEKMAGKYPDVAREIRAIAASVQHVGPSRS